MFNFLYNGHFWWDNVYNCHFGFFYYFVILAFVYILIRRDGRGLFPILWFFVLFAYLQFGSMSLTQYILIHRLDRHLTVVTIPALLGLAYALITFSRSGAVQKTLAGLACIFLLFTSLFYAFHTNQYLKASTWDIKSMDNLFKQHPEKGVFADVGVISHLNFYNDFENMERFKDLALVTNESQLKGSFVVLNGTRGAIETGSGITTPNFTLRNWRLVAVISGPNIDVWGRYDPKIYYVE
jgi:hypothetical protein